MNGVKPNFRAFIYRELFHIPVGKHLLFRGWLLNGRHLMCLNKFLENLHYAIKLCKVSGTSVFTNPVAKFLLLEFMNYIRFTVDSSLGFLSIEAVFEKM